MTGQDVAELYHFLETNPDLHTNGIRLWQGIKAGLASKGRSKEDETKVAVAIARFTNHIAVRENITNQIPVAEKMSTRSQSPRRGSQDAVQDFSSEPLESFRKVTHAKCLAVERVQKRV